MCLCFRLVPATVIYEAVQIANRLVLILKYVSSLASYLTLIDMDHRVLCNGVASLKRGPLTWLSSEGKHKESNCPRKTS